MGKFLSSYFLGRLIGGALRALGALLRSPFRRRPSREEKERNAARRRAGERAEAVVAGVLERAAPRARCYVFNNLPEPSAGDIDHLVVGPGGISLIETKSNRGTLTWDGSPEDPMLIDGRPLHRDPLAQMRRQSSAFERRFSHVPRSEGRGAKPLLDILGRDGTHWMWCFTRARLPGGPHTQRPHLTSPKGIVAEIRAQPALFDGDEVDYLAARIARAYGCRPDAYPARRMGTTGRSR